METVKKVHKHNIRDVAKFTLFAQGKNDFLNKYPFFESGIYYFVTYAAFATTSKFSPENLTKAHYFILRNTKSLIHTPATWKTVYFLAEETRNIHRKRSQFNIFTSFAIVGYHLEINIVRPDDSWLHRIMIPQLDPHPLAEWREHVGEYYLLVPCRIVTVLLNAGVTLWVKIFERLISVAYIYKNKF